LNNRQLTIDNRQFLVLHSGGLGDCVLAMHAARAMAVEWNLPEVAVAARSAIVHWAARKGLIAAAISLDSLGLSPLYSDNGAPNERLNDILCRYDRIVSFLGGADETVSRRLGNLIGKRLVAIDPRPNEETIRVGRHITMQWLASAGIETPIKSDHLDLNPNRRSGPRTRQRAIVHPGSGGLAKCCPIESTEALVGRLRVLEWDVWWMIGPDEVERFGQSFRRQLWRSTDVVYHEDISDAADAVSEADLYIGNDAGMTHVAAAGVPTVALFGPTDPRVWKPLGPAVHVATFPTHNTPIESWVDQILALPGIPT